MALRSVNAFHVDGYVIRRKLADGGMSEVFVAEQAGKEVAIKALAPRLMSDRAARKRMRLEADMYSRVPRNDQVVECLQTGETGGRPWIAMEYYPSISLRQVFKKRRVLSVADAVWYGFQTLSGLIHIHEAGVVHMDMKPENILVNGRERVKIIDFGVCQPISTGWRRFFARSEANGSPSYMSPEQIQGRAVDGRSDIYSLACVIYEMLAGRPPYVSESENTLLNMHVSPRATPRPIREINPRVPGELDRLVRRCLSTEVNHRPPDAGYLNGELQRFLYADEVEEETP
jgi:serine/threonine-protein kinase